MANEVFLQRDGPTSLRDTVIVVAAGHDWRIEGCLHSTVQTSPILTASDCYRKPDDAHAVFDLRAVRQRVGPHGCIDGRRGQQIDFV